MESEPYTEVILLNWNSYDDTAECINSLKEVDYSNYGITVVDNNSTDDSPQQLRKDYPECRIILNDENKGFAAGNNVGIKAAVDDGAEYILLLNNDTIVEPDFLTPLVAKAESEPRAGIVGGKIYVAGTDPPQVWCAGGEIDWASMQGTYFGHTGEDTGEIDQGQFDDPMQVELLSGCMMLIKAELVRDIGMLPEEYFFGGEEWDYSAKTLGAGYELWYVPESVIWHKVTSSTGQSFHAPWQIYNSERHRSIFARNHRSDLVWPLWYVIYVIYQLFIGIRKNYNRTPTDLGIFDFAKIIALAQIDFWRKGAITKADLNKIQQRFAGEKYFETP